MTSIIALADAEALSGKLIPPVSRGLRAIHLLNGSLAKAAKNFALGRPNAQIFGSPALGGGGAYLSFTGLAHYIQTQIEESLYGTYFVVGRATSAMAADASRPMFFGTFQSPAAAGGGNTFGVSMVGVNATTITAYATRGNSTADDTSAAATVADGAAAAWALYCVTVDAGQTITRDLTNGKQNTHIATLPRFRSTGRYRIGSGYNTYAGTCDMGLWAEHDVILNDGEINSWADWIRGYQASKGIVV